MSTPRTGNRPTFRIAGACGIASAGLILAAPSLGSPSIASVVWLFGWLLLLPFLTGVTVLVRDAGGRAAWVSPVIPAASAVLVAVHLVTIGIEHTANGMSTSSPAHEPLHAIGGALFSLGMLPFGVALVAVAVAGLTGRALPRWLAGAGLVIGLVALANGTMIGSESAWGFLLSTVWVLAAGVTLAVRGARVERTPEPATTRA
jgi:hypothetical protein